MSKKDDELIAVAERFSKWQRLLSLQNWYIAVKRGAGLADWVNIEGRWPHNYRHVEFFVGNSFFAMDEEGKDQCIIHELVHLMVAPITDFINNEFADDGVIVGHYRHVEESVVDQIATSIQKLYA